MVLMVIIFPRCSFCFYCYENQHVVSNCNNACQCMPMSKVHSAADLVTGGSLAKRPATSLLQVSTEANVVLISLTTFIDPFGTELQHAIVLSRVAMENLNGDPRVTVRQGLKNV